MPPVPVIFEPGGALVSAPPGVFLLKAAQTAGIEITSTCGGRGRCTSCRIKLIKGTIPPPTIMDELQLGDDLVREGFRLSCQTLVTEPVTVQVSPPLTEEAFQILGAEQGIGGQRIAIDAGVRKRFVTVALPREERHQTSDAEELARAADLQATTLPLDLLRTLPGILREAKGQVTATTFGERLLSVEAGDTAGLAYGLAIDVGTTSVVTTLMELSSGEVLGSVGSLNPQAPFGGDLMSRIAFAQFNPSNLRKLQARILTLLNEQIEEVCRQSGVLPRWIYKVVIVGNSCMHHVLLGIDPSYLGLAPYAPVLRHPVLLPARELRLRLPHAIVCFLPLVAGFVGADAVGVALATRIGDRPETRIAVDIGTNGEAIMGSRERLLASSAPAGPALEGAQIRHGMRAAHGAIDRVRIEGDVRYHVIGEGAPLGICGSGLLDAIAGLLDSGVLDWTGLIQVEDRDGLPPRLRERMEVRGEERCFVLVTKGESATGQEIVLTQDDIRQVQLAKGAIASGVLMLQKIMGVPTRETAELMLAGGFGNYLSIRSALRIGLVPPLPEARIRYVGNAAALGAQMCLMSEAERARAAQIARRIEHISLAGHPDFQDVFVEAMNFPRSAPTLDSYPDSA